MNEITCLSDTISQRLIEYADGELPAATRAMAARLLSMDPLSLASTKSACAALANAMVPKEVTWSDAEMMLLAYRQGTLRSRADSVETHDD